MNSNRYVMVLNKRTKECKFEGSKIEDEWQRSKEDIE